MISIDPADDPVYWTLNRRWVEDDGTHVFELWWPRRHPYSTFACPTIPTLCRAVTYKGPQPDDVDRVERVGTHYRLYCTKRCPVLFFGGPICPMCGENHSDGR